MVIGYTSRLESDHVYLCADANASAIGVPPSSSLLGMLEVI